MASIGDPFLVRVVDDLAGPARAAPLSCWRWPGEFFQPGYPVVQRGEVDVQQPFKPCLDSGLARRVHLWLPAEDVHEVVVAARNPAKHRTPRKAETIRVVLPAEPPPLNPEAARILLRILKAHDRLTDNDHPDGGTE